MNPVPDPIVGWFSNYLPEKINEVINIFKIFKCMVKFIKGKKSNIAKLRNTFFSLDIVTTMHRLQLLYISDELMRKAAAPWQPFRNRSILYTVQYNKSEKGIRIYVVINYIKVIKTTVRKNKIKKNVCLFYRWVFWCFFLSFNSNNIFLFHMKDNFLCEKHVYTFFCSGNHFYNRERHFTI